MNGLRSHLTKIEEKSIASDIIIRGIPATEHENLSDIFTTLCANINCPNIKINNAFRLKNNNARNNFTTDAGIIVKLSSLSDKSKILRAAASYRKQNSSTLTLRIIGLDSDTPIYINECLTKINKQILNAAVRLKRSRHLWAVYTLRGRVYVKRAQGDNPIEATSIDIINNLVGSNSQQPFFHDNSASLN